MLRLLPVKKLLRFTLIFVISLCLTRLLYISGITDNWDLNIYDFCINNRVLNSTEKKSTDIASVALTDESIEMFIEQLDTRLAFADALEVLERSDVAGVVLDFLFRYKKQNDDDFAYAVKLVNDPVIAVVAIEEKMMNPLFRELSETEKEILQRHIWNIKVLDKGNIPKADTFLLPVPVLMEAAKQIAHINIDPDPDGIYRRQSLLYEWNGGYIPSLALASAVLFYEIPISSIELKAGSYLALPLSDNVKIKIPIDRQGRMFIPFSETWEDNKTRIPFHTIIKAKDDPKIFNEVLNGLRGRIVFIAEISTSQKDIGPVSFERLYPLSGIHTEVLGSILKGLNKRAFIGKASFIYNFFTLMVLLVCTFFCSNIKKDLKAHLGFLVTLLVFTGITFFRWQYAVIYPWYALPATFLILMWVSTFLFRLVERYREQVLLQSALSRYFPRALAQRIIHERKTDLIPAHKELTILFSDIAGFTKWSSEKTPEQVHDFLSDYLESMAGILFAHGGTVDKYMGDGIIAFFGDPFEMPDHCERCVNAAIVMQKKVLLLAEKWKPLLDIDLKVRIGINTGKVIVGNLGSKARIEYTVIGAAVNLAQRMESNAPPGGILVTVDVWERIKDKFSFSQKQLIHVKGYSNVIEAYLVE